MREENFIGKKRWFERVHLRQAEAGRYKSCRGVGWFACIRCVLATLVSISYWQSTLMDKDVDGEKNERRKEASEE